MTMLRGGPFRYFGGKQPLVPRLLTLVPPGGRPYVEPYAGAASLLFAREPAPVEVLNDLDGRIVEFFRVLQDPRSFKSLAHRLRFTLYSRAEFQRAVQILRDERARPLDRAWAWFVALNQGFSGFPNQTPGRWGVNLKANGAAPWLGKLARLEAWHQRLQRVQIEALDALDCIARYDSPETVFYIDPPYVLATRRDRNAYAVEPTDDHHRRLVELLGRLRGAVVLSGYSHPIYRPLEKAGWERLEFRTVACSAARTRQTGILGPGASKARVPRTEVVWRNPRAAALADPYRRKKGASA